LAWSENIAPEHTSIQASIKHGLERRSWKGGHLSFVELDRRVAQISKSAVPPISKSAPPLRVWKPALRQTWKSALQFSASTKVRAAPVLACRIFIILKLGGICALCPSEKVFA
jgi:hypothetical protein